MKIRTLQIRHSISRGRETYGWGVVTLRESGKRKAIAKGGGYDMVGTVFGDWLQAEYQDRLYYNRLLCASTYRGADGFSKVSDNPNRLYGACWLIDKGKVSLDGGCGIEAMRKVAESIGLTVKFDFGKYGLDEIVVFDESSE